MPQSLAAKRLIRARLLRSINRRSHLSSANSSTLKNCKFFPVIFIKKVRRWYRQTFKYCDIWYNSMKDIEGRFGSKLAVYFKILRYLVMLNFFVTIFTFRWVWWEIVSVCCLMWKTSVSLSHCSFIIFPQIIYDGFQADDTSAGNESLSNSFEFVDILTGDVSECFARVSALFFGIEHYLRMLGIFMSFIRLAATTTWRALTVCCLDCENSFITYIIFSFVYLFLLACLIFIAN